MRGVNLLLVELLLGGLLLGLACACATERRAVPVERTSGVVLKASPDVVWEETRNVVMGVGRMARADESTRTVRAFVGLGSVTARVEPYDSTASRAILRVVAQANGADSPQPAQKVLNEIVRRVQAR